MRSILSDNEAVSFSNFRMLQQEGHSDGWVNITPCTGLIG